MGGPGEWIAYIIKIEKFREIPENSGKIPKIIRKFPRVSGRAENEKWTVGISDQNFPKRKFLMAYISNSKMILILNFLFGKF